MAIIYEVNLRIESAIYAAYYEWLKTHVQEMLTLPGFQTAVIQRPETAFNNGKAHLTVSYRLTSKAALEHYFKNHAQAMRADGLKRFGDQFTAERRVLEVLETISAS